MLKEFKDFLMRGNVLDLAVAVIIGGAFGGIATSLVNADAQAAGAPTINYGTFINTLINFLIVGIAIFLVIRTANRLQRPKETEAHATKECPHCLSTIPLNATRCPHCTSQL